MKMDMSDRVCPGCGSKLQTDDPDRQGYIPEHLMSGEDAICQRCFKLKHYAKGSKAPLMESQVFSIVKQQMGGADLVLLISDPMSISDVSSIISQLKPDKPIWLVLNKSDLLRRWMSLTSALSKVGTGFERSFAVSSKTGDGFPQLISSIKGCRRGSGDLRVLVAGSVNCGKSTLFRKLSRVESATSSALPGTTLDVIKGKCDGVIFSDTPGITGANRYLRELCTDCLMSLDIGRKISRKVVILQARHTLFIGGLARIEIIDGMGKNSVKATAFVPAKVVLHRSQTIKTEEYSSAHLGSDLTPPCGECMKDDIECIKYDIKIGIGQDLVLPYLGWFSFYGGGALVRVSMRGGAEPTVRDSLVPPPVRIRRR